MPNSTQRHGYYMLRDTDRPEVLKHFLALTPPERHLRFHATISDAVIHKWTASLNLHNTCVGFYHWGELVGLAMLIPTGVSRSEFAISILSAHQGRGLGHGLAEWAMQRASAMGVQWVDVQYVRTNRPMARIAQRFPGSLRSDGPEEHRTVDIQQLAVD